MKGMEKMLTAITITAAMMFSVPTMAQRAARLDRPVNAVKLQAQKVQERSFVEMTNRQHSNQFVHAARPATKTNNAYEQRTLTPRGLANANEHHGGGHGGGHGGPRGGGCSGSYCGY